jgi:hypothetical protein
LLLVDSLLITLVVEIVLLTPCLGLAVRRSVLVLGAGGKQEPGGNGGGAGGATGSGGTSGGASGSGTSGN